MQNEEPTIHDVLEAISTFSTKIEKTMATKEDLKAFATKEDLTREISGLRSHMIDHVSSQNMHLEHKLVSLMDRQDNKIDLLVDVLQEKSVLTKADANRITNLEPFPQGV